jgi:hypothetical protein
MNSAKFTNVEDLLMLGDLQNFFEHGRDVKLAHLVPAKEK